MVQLLPTIYAAAVLLPLASFAVILLCAPFLGRLAGTVATGAILFSGFLSVAGLGIWLTNHFPAPQHHGEHAAPVEQASPLAPSHAHASTHGRSPFQLTAF